MDIKRLIRLDEVVLRTGLSRSSIYLKISNKKFPPQINLGGKSVAWIEKEIIDWIDNQITLSRQLSNNNFQDAA